MECGGGVIPGKAERTCLPCWMTYSKTALCLSPHLACFSLLQGEGEKSRAAAWRGHWALCSGFGEPLPFLTRRPGLPRLTSDTSIVEMRIFFSFRVTGIECANQ